MIIHVFLYMFYLIIFGHGSDWGKYRKYLEEINKPS